MRRWTLILAVVTAAAAVGYYWLFRTPSQNEPDQPLHQASVAQDGTEPDETEPMPVHRGRTIPPESGPEDSDDRVQRVDRVEFDRRPWDPAKESREIHDLRAEVVEAFDRFVEETGMSEERARAVMMLLYDYQETVKTISKPVFGGMPYRDKWRFEFLLRKTGHDRRLVTYEALEAIEEMLTPDEFKAWKRNLADIQVWWRLSYYPNSPPILVPVDQSGTP